MSGGFFKFPSTPQLATMAGVDVRGDKTLSVAERAAFLRHELLVEEKVDGANLGLSFSADGELLAQNRGAYLTLPAQGQWKKLHEWMVPRADILLDALLDRYILFGEWLYAKHSVFYARLPDWFLGFDVFDKEMRRFLCAERRDALLARLNVAAVPRVGHGMFDLAGAQNLLAQSQIGDDAAEGLYLRYDEGEWLGGRGKLVRGGFVQAIGKHWSRSALVTNRLAKTEYVEGKRDAVVSIARPDKIVARA